MFGSEEGAINRRLALVTGASAGIGAAFARALARRGFDLALTARRADRLEALASELRRSSGVETLVLPADLERPEAPGELLDAISARGWAVDALVNNAGYGVTGSYLDSDWPTHAAFLRIMVDAPCELAHAVLPGMRERGFGRICNVASVAGLAPGTAGHTLYAAAKSFLIKFSQSLNAETLGSGVHVSALCPGFTYSEFHDVNGTRERVSRMPAWMWLDADRVVADGLAALEANRAVCVPGLQYKAITALMRLTPEPLAEALSRRQSHRYRQA